MHVGSEAGTGALAQSLSAVDHMPDAQVLAEAAEMAVGYFVSPDRKHLVGNPRTEHVMSRLGLQGDFSEWYRQHLMEGEHVLPGYRGE